MARIGWTAVAVVGSEPESWYRLSVFDDGWVEMLGAGRAAARVRGDLRRVLIPLGFVVVVFGLFMLMPHLGLTDTWAGIVSMVAGLALVAVLLVTAGSQIPRSFARMRDGKADREQLLRERAEHGALRRTPGAPALRRATSAVELASWLTPVRLTRASDIVELTLTIDGDDQVAVIRLTDGTARAYRTPDGSLHKNLSQVAVAPGVLQRLS